jgi:hypothetical protein
VKENLKKNTAASGRTFASLGSRKKGIEAMTTNSPSSRRSRSFRYVYKPNRKVRLHHRRVLVELLLEEITHGSGLNEQRESEPVASDTS